MGVRRSLLAFIFFLFASLQVWSQCDQLKSTINIDFGTDQDCAPVTVNQFEITYSFSIPQDPATIRIIYEWNNPTNDRTVIDINNGLIVGASGSGVNTTFTANASRLYTENDGQCVIQPTVSISINGVQCPSSIQTQTAFLWDIDENGNGEIALDPETWEVCYDNAIVGAQFRDVSEFNCNMIIEPDHPNQRTRHVQFVYGTNHNPGATIRNLSLNDGAVQQLTNGAGALATSATRGTGAVTVTGAYFGPVDAIPFPANGPTSLTFPMNAPADAANAIGNRFEITLYNWNTCNPWNGNATHPNYEDAVITRGYIQIVEAPQPDFFTRDASGNVKTNFCIDEIISFRNSTPNVGAYGYTWEFYDDAIGTTLISTSTQGNPNFTFTSGGAKLIRLTAQNPTAQGSCVEVFEGFVNITPSLTARIAITDPGGNPINPDFCQEHTAALTNFDVRFSDISSGIVTPTTTWRWEFYDQNNTLILDAPAGANIFSGTPLGPFDRVFSTSGIYRIRLRIKDNLTDCETSDEVTVRVFEKPNPQFSFNRVCEGAVTNFVEASTLDAIAGDQITSWEWDMNYDGATFVPDPALNNQRNHDYTFASPGSYQVALRVTASGSNCSDFFDQTVIVDPLPIAAFTADQTSGCSLLPVEFTNNSIAGQPDIIKEYIWEVDDGTGFVPDAVQRPDDPGFSNIFRRNFINTGAVNRAFRIRLRVITVNDCDFTSAPLTITVFPQPRAGFVSLNYSPFNDNCSPVSVDFTVDNQTQLLNPTDYTWIINDASGLVDQISTGTTPAFEYPFNNTSPAVKDFFVTLRATLPSTCYGDSTRTIRVSPIPTSDFAVDTVVYECDRIVLSIDAAQKGLAEYTWNIFSNTVLIFTSTTAGENFEYEILRSTSVDQNISIELVTKNLANCDSEVTTGNFLARRTDNMGASFSVTPAVQTLPASTVTITNTTNPGPWEFQWDLGDGSTSDVRDVANHTYETFGIYTISLTVSNNDCTETRSATVRINPIPPILDFDYLPSSGCAPHTVSFINRSRFADPATYLWEFGTGEGTSRAIDPDYTYNRPGVYSVTLSATNELGDTVTLTKELIIEVLRNPVAQFAVYPTTPLNVPGEILYTDNRSLNAADFIWDFGDGKTSTDFEPQHLYTEEGEFTITLIANNGNGCSDTTALVSGVKTVKSGQLLIPNAFIPNKHGAGSGNALNNEVFLPLVQLANKFQMMIFNRWGELMFESTNPLVGWDGYYQGKLCAQDVYIYRITVEYENGRTITRTGDINLIR
jgi:gliding motility-associated-like protein